MKLISIKFLNFRRFAKEELFFSDDFSMIFWKNGSGKSSVLDAIWYALFGPSSKDFVRVNTTLLKSYFVQDRSRSKVELNFQVGTVEYKIVRIIDTGIKKLNDEFIPETKDSLFNNEGVEIIGWTEVTNFVETLIWVDRNTFLRSVFARQKDLEVLSWPTKERKKLINSILWLDKLEKINEEFKSKTKLKESEHNILKKQWIEFDEDKEKETLKNLESELKEKKEILKKSEILLKEKNSTFEKLKKDYLILDEKSKNYTKIKNEINLLTQKIENIKKIILDLENSLENILKIENELKTESTILKEFDEKDKQNEKLLNDKKDFELKKTLEKQKKSEEENLKILEKNLEILKNLDIKKLLEKNKIFWEKFLEEKNILEKEILILDNKKNIITTQWKELSLEFEELNKLWDKADCPTCKRPLLDYLPKLKQTYISKIDEKRAEWKKLDNEYQKIKPTFEEKKLEQKKLETEKQELDKKDRELELLQEKVKNAKKNIEDKNNQLEKYKEISYDDNIHKILLEELSILKQKVLVYNQKLWLVKTKPDLEEKLKNSKNLLEDLQENLKKTQEFLGKINFDEKTYIETKKVYDDFNEELSLLNKDFLSKNKDFQESEYAFKNQNKLIMDFQESQKKLIILREEVDLLQLKQDIVSNYILHLLDHLKPNIESIASNYFNMITDYKYFEITLDDDYNILIDGKNLNLYSWWEKDLANLCLRLALGQNLSQTHTKNSINFLVLDEVLWSQDKQRQKNILENLKKLEHKFSQILLVSHLDEVKDFSTNLVEIKETNKDESKIIQY